MGSKAQDDEASNPDADTDDVDALRAEIEQLTAQVDELEAQNDALADKLDALETEKEDVTDTLARVQADYENYRKRAKREKQEAARNARVDLIAVLADVIDNVHRALDADPSPEVEKGLDMVLQRIEKELDALGVDRLAPEPGDAFDPNDHEPVITEETTEHAPETVIEQLQPGYALAGRQVRPALVKVAKAPTEPDEEGDESAKTQDADDA